MTKQVVFIDGIGGKTYMRGALVRFFKRHGFDITCIDFSASDESFANIQARVGGLLETVAARGKYFVIGYSFGGVIARTVLQEPRFKFAQPEHLVLLASPIKSSCLGKAFADWRLFRWMTGGVGKIVINDQTMAAIGFPNTPTSCVYGVWGWLGLLGFLRGFRTRHDGMLTEEEISPESFSRAISISASHAFIPSNQQALQAILSCFQQSETSELETKN